MRIHPLVLLVLLAACTPAGAQEANVIYRCTDASGALTFRNGTPCAKGSKQEKRIVSAPSPMPAYVTPPDMPKTKVPPTAPPSLPPPTPINAPRPRPLVPPPALIADADRLPPPPIHRCNTWDNDSYLSESADPKPRCVRLDTTGLDGNPDTGAGQACEMKADQCQRVPDGAACDAWKQHQREIESAWRYAPGGDKQKWQDAFARVTRILNDTTCGK